MPFNPDVHRRKSIRLLNYDYSQNGLYFITICTRERLPLFGEIVGGVMDLNQAGIMVDKIWREIPEKYSGVAVDEFVIMPNHIHGIVELANVGAASDNHRNDVIAPVVGAQFIAPNECADKFKKGAINRAPTIGQVVREFKARCTHAINGIDQMKGRRVWHRNYYEHIIRNEPAYLKIVEYIQTNPLKWLEDKYYTGKVSQ